MFGWVKVKFIDKIGDWRVSIIVFNIRVIVIVCYSIFVDFNVLFGEFLVCVFKFVDDMWRNLYI